MAIVELTPEEEKYSDMKLWAQNLERENDKLKLRLERLEKIEEDMEERAKVICWRCNKPIKDSVKWLQSNPPKPEHGERKDCLKEKRERK